MSQVKTLSDEMEASFICGTTPDERVGFLPAEAEGCLSIEEAIQMMQEAYDTYMAN